MDYLNYISQILNCLRLNSCRRSDVKRVQYR